MVNKLLEVIQNNQILEIKLSGNLQRYDNREQIDALLRQIPEVKKICLNAENLQKWDSAIVAVLYKAVLAAEQNKVEVDYQKLSANLQKLLKLALEVDRKATISSKEKTSFLESVGSKGIEIYAGICKVEAFLREVAQSLGRLLRGKVVMRMVDFEFALEDCGYKAVGIVALVSFMVGLILAFVGALQLKMFGAQIYIASLVAIGMTRIMGAIMAGIIIAGRTGAAYAAEIGTMQVNEEVDALKTLGLPVTDFLVMPRMLSLIITMPFLTILADIMGMLGGAFVAVLLLDISAVQYWNYSIDAFEMDNFLVGVFHGLIYGIIISCTGCYYGINCGRDADSVGKSTTQAVVSAIVIMIVVTGILTSVFEALGI